MFLWNYFTKVICKVPCTLIYLTSIYDEIDHPLSTVFESASLFFAVGAKI